MEELSICNNLEQSSTYRQTAIPYFGLNHIQLIKIRDSINLGKIWDLWYDNKDGIGYIIKFKDINNIVFPYCVIVEEFIDFAQQIGGQPEQIIIKNIYSLKDRLYNILYDVNNINSYNKVYFIEDKITNHIYRYDESFKDIYFINIIEYIANNYDNIEDNFLKKNIMFEAIDKIN